jgi:hypothetical protein
VSVVSCSFARCSHSAARSCACARLARAEPAARSVFVTRVSCSLWRRCKAANSPSSTLLRSRTRRSSFNSGSFAWVCVTSAERCSSCSVVRRRSSQWVCCASRASCCVRRAVSASTAASLSRMAKPASASRECTYWWRRELERDTV